MKTPKSKSALLALAVAAALSATSAKAQVVNPNFADGLTGWTVNGSNTKMAFGYNQAPLGPFTAAGVVGLQNGAVIIRSGNFPPDFQTINLVTSQLSQKFSLPSSLPAFHTGRLQLIGKVNISFDWQALSNEAPGAPFDYVRAAVNGRTLVVDELRMTGNNNTPGAFGFFRSSSVNHFSGNIGGLSEGVNTLSFSASDTIDSVVDSGLAISNLKLKFRLADVEAINSVYNSGLPVVLAQRQLLFNVAFNANRDVNARLFRLRSEIDEVTGAAGPSGDGKACKECKKEIVPEEKRWAFFATGNYGYRDQNNVNLTAGFQTDLFTATIGGEYKLTPHLTIGVAATRVEADNDLGALGTSDIEGWSYDAYISYAANHFYADLLYALGTYNNQINRNTGFLGQGATARPDSLTNSLQFNTGYNIPVGRFVTGPLASLNWVHADIDGYNEQQGGNADLTVPKQHADSLTSEFGWQLSMPFHTGFGSVTPQVRASWVHDYLNTTKDVTVGLQNSPYYLVDGASVSRFGSFNATGSTSAAGNDYMSVGAGVAFGIGDRAAIVVDWEAHFFQAHASSQNVSLTGEIKF
ncbi:autotransporter outer membrane beta-barrel domain-containing protein [Chthoniobacter flavus]|uniref:autotransporter outer membrane beta-barrel domain-containing protein n=1 Tax=Chthoniobacter flavus TaxID=191863 RepID=UPI0012FC2CF3|nr:autotransporter outer membrane beta-barrel domain-containing protein [Chthoniobacter flavus]